MKLGDRLVQLRKEKHYTRDEFAQLLGISKYTLRNYELGVTEPGHSFLIKIAGLFDTSIDYILGLTEEREKMHSYKLKTSEFERIEKYRSLDAHGKDMVDTVLIKEYNRCEADKKENVIPIAKEPLPEHLIVQAAHNDSVIDGEELEKMQRDIELLKSYRK